MSTRRTHTKSRTGCTNCKRRKVKCDEAYPVCFNCKRHGDTCGLSLGAAAIATDRFSPHLPPTIVSDQTPLTQELSGDKNGASPFDPLRNIFPGSDQILPCPPQELWSRDLELLHHYCTVTAQTLATRHDIIHVWQNAMPREGYQRPFVLHGLLSVAAVHKAYLVQSQRKTYLALSDYHHTVGSEGFRLQLQNITNDNWLAVFSFASVVALYMMCLPARSEGLRLEDPITNILELMSVVRGIRATLGPILPRVYRTEFAPIVYGAWPTSTDEEMDREPSLQYTNLPLDTFDALRMLRAFQRADIPSNSEVHYAKATENLEVLAKLVANAGLHVEWGIVLSWPYGLHESILVDIQTKKPHALLLLAYLAIYFAAIEKPFWHARGWAKGLLDEAEKLLAGQPRFFEFLEWPKKQMAELYGWS